MARRKEYMGAGWWVFCYPNQNRYLVGKEGITGIHTYKTVFSTFEEAKEFVFECRIEDDYLDWKYGEI